MTDIFARLRTALSDRYEIQEELGAGGMATVYLAEDLKHHRKVAVKVLRPELAAVLGAERFLQEITTTANLQHPHILPLFDSGEADTFLYYVMPFIEGESLRDKLDREKQVSIEEAVRIATQVADALHYAHGRKVIHRDVKPENILLHSGNAMVADFGIALAVQHAGGTRLTGTGLSLGTPHYMSPEQATADRELDAKSDISSLGCVTYEMLVGEPPHTGPTAQAVIASVVTKEPDFVTERRKTVPPHVEAAVHKALEKLPADRWSTADDFARALADATARPVARRSPREAGARHLGASRITLGLLAGLALAIGVGAAGWIRAARPPQAASSAVRRYDLVLPDSAPMAFVGQAAYAVGQPALALSPDGSVLAYAAQRGATTQLHLMDLEQGATRAVQGSEGAYAPFFSPDGRWVGFFSRGEMKKADTGGGEAVVLARVDAPYGAIWTREGRILVPEFFGYRPTWVPEAGGTPVAALNRRTTIQIALPSLLPDGRHVVHSGFARMLYVTSLETGETHALTLEGLVPLDSDDNAVPIIGTTPRYVSGGWIVFLRGSVLMALPFDGQAMRVTGTPQPVVHGIRAETELGSGQFAVAEDGTMIYAFGTDASLSFFVRRTRAGVEDTLPFPERSYSHFKATTDGTRFLARVHPEEGPAELWLLDAQRGTQARLRTLDTGAEHDTGFFHWWRDQQSFAFTDVTAPDRGTFLSSLVSGERTKMATPNGFLLKSVGPNDELFGGDPTIATTGFRSGEALVAVSADGGTVQVVDSLGGLYPSASPDGRWLAYSSNKSGSPQIYVVGLGATVREAYQVTPDGGEEGVWTPEGDEIVFRNGNRWYAIPVTIGEHFTFDRPGFLFEGAYQQVIDRSHDVVRGRGHILLKGTQVETTLRLAAITNLQQLIRRRAPPSER